MLSLVLHINTAPLHHGCKVDRQRTDYTLIHPVDVHQYWKDTPIFLHSHSANPLLFGTPIPIIQGFMWPHPWPLSESPWILMCHRTKSVASAHSIWIHCKVSKCGESHFDCRLNLSVTPICHVASCLWLKIYATSRDPSSLWEGLVPRLLQRFRFTVQL